MTDPNDEELQADIRHEAQVDPAVVAQAIATAKAAGWVVLKAKAYRQAQERQHIAQSRADWAEKERDSHATWARNCLDEERRLRDRLTFVYGVARAFGASVDDLRGPDAQAGSVGSS